MYRLVFLIQNAVLGFVDLRQKELNLVVYQRLKGFQNNDIVHGVTSVYQIEM